MKTAVFAALVCLAMLAGCTAVDDNEHRKGSAAALDPEAKLALAKTDIRTIGTALDLYRFDYSRYPTTAEGLRSLVEQPTDPAALRLWHKGGYLRTLPKDPWGHDYQYAYPSTHGEVYDLSSLGPSGNGHTLITSWKTPAN